MSTDYYQAARELGIGLELDTSWIDAAEVAEEEPNPESGVRGSFPEEPERRAPMTTKSNNPSLRRLAHLAAKADALTSHLEAVLEYADSIERRIATLRKAMEEIGPDAGVEVPTEPVKTNDPGVPVPAFRDLPLTEAAPILGRSYEALSKEVRKRENRNGESRIGPGLVAYRSGSRWYVRVPTSA